MENVKWIKICTDIFDDEKMCLIESMPEADGIIVCWFKLLCMAGKQNNSGVFMFNKIAYTDEMLAKIFRRPLDLVQRSLETFVSFGMVEIVDNVYTIPNWGKHQSLDQLEAKTAYMRKYMREYRDKQKGLISGKTNSKANSKANVRQADKEKDKEKEKSTYVPKKNKNERTDERDEKQREFFETYPDIVIDNYSTADYADIDFAVLLEEFALSKKVLQKKRSFKWICSHWAEISKGSYRDWETETPKPPQKTYSSGVQCWEGD